MTELHHVNELGDRRLTPKPEHLTMNKRTYNVLWRLECAGISPEDAKALRRIAMALHRWHVLECGINYGYIERDEETGVPYWLNARTGRRAYRVADRETGALRRLAAIMARYPALSAYVQGDPRGAALYILRPGDVPEGGYAEDYYSYGMAVYK